MHAASTVIAAPHNSNQITSRKQIHDAGGTAIEGHILP